MRIKYLEDAVNECKYSENEYNKNLIQVFKRRRFGENKERINNRQPHHLFYNGINELDFPVTIQHTKQWIIYENLDPSFNFDWSTIKYKLEEL